MDKGKLYIYRGLPGSGKSTAANRNLDVDFVFEADQYFMIPGLGEYWFDPTQLGAAHQQCQWRTKNALERGYNVAVANTFTQLWEIKPYLEMTKDVFVYCCTGKYKNIHGVSYEVIKKMSDRFEIYPGEFYI